MQQQKLRALRQLHPLSADDFAKYFLIFVGVSHEYEAISQILSQHLTKLSTGCFMLDIGAGLGSPLKELTRVARDKIVLYHGMEQNTMLAKELTKTIDELLPSCPFVQIQQAKWPHAVDEEKRHQTYYNLILMSHCLYEVPNRLHHILTAMLLLTKDKQDPEEPPKTLFVFHRQNDIGSLIPKLKACIASDKRWTMTVTENLPGYLDLSNLNEEKDDQKINMLMSINYGLNVAMLNEQDKKGLLSDFQSQMTPSEHFPCLNVCIQLTFQ